MDSSLLSTEFRKIFRSFKTAVSDDTYLHYVWGGQGPTLLLIHGFPQSWYMWRKVMEPLAKKFTVIAPDLRGCGDSDKTSGPFDAFSLAQDLDKLLTKIGLNKDVHVVGHDMGAPVALSYAAQFEQTRSVVYIDEPVFGVNLDHLARFGADNKAPLWWWPFHHQPSLAELLINGKESEYFDFFVFSKTHVSNLWAMTEDDKSEYIRHLKSASGITGALGGYRDVFITQKRLEILKSKKLKIPVIAVEGEFGVKGVAAALRTYADSVREYIIQDSGHFVAEEQPEQVTKMLLELIQ